MKKNEQKQFDVLKEKELKKDLLSFVMGGLANPNDDAEAVDGCSKYADSIYVKKDPPVVIVKPKPIGS